MSGLQDAVNAPVIVTLGDGKDYTLRKIGLQEWCEFCDWINRGLDRKLGTAVSMEEMLEHASTVIGMRWLVWKSMRVDHPKMTAQQVGQIVPFGRLQEIVGSIMDLPASVSDDESAEGNAVEESTGASSAP